MLRSCESCATCGCAPVATALLCKAASTLICALTSSNRALSRSISPRKPGGNATEYCSHQLRQPRPPTCFRRRLCNSNSEPMRLRCAVCSCPSRSSSRCARCASSCSALGTRATDHTRRSPAWLTHQHRQQLVAIEAVGLGAPGTTIDFDAGRIDHQIVDALRNQPAVQPETVATRLIATVHDHCSDQTRACLRLGDGRQRCPLIASHHRVAARCSRTVAHHQLPLLVTQFKSYVRLTSYRRMLSLKGCFRCLHRRAPFVKSSWSNSRFNSRGPTWNSPS